MAPASWETLEMSRSVCMKNTTLVLLSLIFRLMFSSLSIQNTFLIIFFAIYMWPSQADSSNALKETIKSPKRPKSFFFIYLKSFVARFCLFVCLKNQVLAECLDYFYLLCSSETFGWSQHKQGLLVESHRKCKNLWASEYFFQ